MSAGKRHHPNQNYKKQSNHYIEYKNVKSNLLDYSRPSSADIEIAINNASIRDLRRLQQRDASTHTPQQADLIREALSTGFDFGGGSAGTPQPRPESPVVSAVVSRKDTLAGHAVRGSRYTVCPPEWNLTPTQYLSARADCDSVGDSVLLAGLALSVMGGSAAVATYDATHGTTPAWVPVAFSVIFLVVLIALAVQLTTRRRTRTMMAAFDPALAIDIKTDRDRDTLKTIAQPLSDKNLSPDERQRVLTGMYVVATRMAEQEQADDFLTALGEGAREERRTRWDRALDRFEAVDTAWANLITDPLAVLDHARLLDVAHAPTERFIEAHGRARDLIGSRTRTDLPTDGTLDTIETAVRALDTAWNDARTRAERAGYDWLPAADRRRARQAHALLVAAADDSCTLAERASAAEKALALLQDIETVPVPKPILTTLAAVNRPELAAAPILSEPVLSESLPISPV
jgi:hypothetical protein